jgi:hypothetical protein
MSTELSTKMKTILDDAQLPERHTFFQIQKFIIGKEPTIQAQLWQIVRELRARNDSYEAMELQIQELEDDLALLDIESKEMVKFGEFKNPLEEEKYRIHVRKQARRRRSMESSKAKIEIKLKNLSEEIGYLVQCFEVISEREAMKPLDDYESQKTYWDQKMIEEFGLRKLLQRPLDVDFVRTVLALDDDMEIKKQVVGLLTRTQQRLLEQRTPPKAIKEK